jgi:hypothetical protein
MPARHVTCAFWRPIAQGKRTEEAALEIGVSTPVAVRWFHHAGGMPLSLAKLTSRCLAFSEREKIALLRAPGHGVREIARELRRDPGTISRECGAMLRPVAASWTTRRVSRWKAQVAARRPKPMEIDEHARSRSPGGWSSTFRR